MLALSTEHQLAEVAQAALSLKTFPPDIQEIITSYYALCNDRKAFLDLILRIYSDKRISSYSPRKLLGNSYDIVQQTIENPEKMQQIEDSLLIILPENNSYTLEQVLQKMIYRSPTTLDTPHPAIQEVLGYPENAVTTQNPQGIYYAVRGRVFLAPFLRRSDDKKTFFVHVWGPDLHNKFTRDYKKLVIDHGGCLDMVAYQTIMDNMVYLTYNGATAERGDSHLRQVLTGFSDFFAAVPEVDKPAARQAFVNAVAKYIQLFPELTVDLYLFDPKDFNANDQNSFLQKFEAAKAQLPMDVQQRMHFVLGQSVVRPLTPDEEKAENFVISNAWDPWSLIGNFLSKDPTVDGFLVSGWDLGGNIFPNTSYLHNVPLMPVQCNPSRWVNYHPKPHITATTITTQQPLQTQPPQPIGESPLPDKPLHILHTQPERHQVSLREQQEAPSLSPMATIHGVQFYKGGRHAMRDNHIADVFVASVGKKRDGSVTIHRQSKHPSVLKVSGPTFRKQKRHYIDEKTSFAILKRSYEKTFEAAEQLRNAKKKPHITLISPVLAARASRGTLSYGRLLRHTLALVQTLHKQYPHVQLSFFFNAPGIENWLAKQQPSDNQQTIKPSYIHTETIPLHAQYLAHPAPLKAYSQNPIAKQNKNHIFAKAHQQLGQYGDALKRYKDMHFTTIDFDKKTIEAWMERPLNAKETPLHSTESYYSYEREDTTAAFFVAGNTFVGGGFDTDGFVMEEIFTAVMIPAAREIADKKKAGTPYRVSHTQGGPVLYVDGALHTIGIDSKAVYGRTIGNITTATLDGALSKGHGTQHNMLFLAAQNVSSSPWASYTRKEIDALNLTIGKGMLALKLQGIQTVKGLPLGAGVFGHSRLISFALQAWWARQLGMQLVLYGTKKWEKQAIKTLLHKATGHNYAWFSGVLHNFSRYKQNRSKNRDYSAAAQGFPPQKYWQKNIPMKEKLIAPTVFSPTIQATAHAPQTWVPLLQQTVSDKQVFGNILETYAALEAQATAYITDPVEWELIAPFMVTLAVPNTQSGNDFYEYLRTAEDLGTTPFRKNTLAYMEALFALKLANSPEYMHLFPRPHRDLRDINIKLYINAFQDAMHSLPHLKKLTKDYRATAEILASA